MSQRHKIVALLPITLLGACAGLRTLQSPIPVDAVNEQMSTSIARSWTALDSAIALRDTARLGELVAADAELVTPDGRAVRGPSAIARALLGGNQHPAGPYTLVLGEAQLDVCIDGGLQTGAYSLGRVDSSRTTNIEAGAYSIRWVVASAGARLGRMALAPDPHRARVAGGSCHMLREAVFHQRRLTVALEPLNVASTTVPQLLENELRSAGWTRAAAIPTGVSTSSSGWMDTPALLSQGGAVTRSNAFDVIGGYRLVPATMVQATVQVLPQWGYFVTFNPSNSVRLIQHYSARDGSVELMREWRGIRFGAGPAVVTTNWQQRSEKVVVQNGTYATDFSTLVDSHWAKTQWGGVGELAYAKALTSVVFVEFSMRGRAGAPATMDGDPSQPNWSIGMNAVQFGGRVGVSW